MAKAFSGKKPQHFGNTIRVFLNYLGRHKFMLGLVGVLTAVSALANLLGTYMIKPVVNGILETGSIPGLVRGVALTAAIYAVGALSTLGYTQTMVRAAQKVLHDIRRDLFAHLQTLPLSFFDSRRNGELMSLFTNDVDTVVLVDVAQYPVHHPVRRHIGRKRALHAAVRRALIDGNHQLHQAANGQQVAAITFLHVQAAQLVQLTAHLGAAGAGQAQQIGMAGHRGVKATGQAGVRAGKGFQIPAVHPQHNALVRFIIAVNPRLVQLQRADQHQIPRAHVEDAVFDRIRYTAAQKHVDFIKIVVVQLHFIHVAVAVNFKIPADHGLPPCKGLKAVFCHNPVISLSTFIVPQFLQSFKQLRQFDLQKIRVILIHGLNEQHRPCCKARPPKISQNKI